MKEIEKVIENVNSQIEKVETLKKEEVRLSNRLQEVKKEINFLLGDVGHVGRPKGRSNTLPYGSITRAVQKTLSRSRKPMHVDEIYAEVKKSVKFNQLDLTHLRDSVYTSSKFRNIGKGKFICS